MHDHTKDSFMLLELQMCAIWVLVSKAMKMLPLTQEVSPRTSLVQEVRPRL